MYICSYVTHEYYTMENYVYSISGYTYLIIHKVTI